MNKKRILCFGDSNTWGYIPNTKYLRFSEDERFPKVLQKKLGTNFEIIEEGLNSRTLVSEDTRPNKQGRNGSSYLIPCLDSHDPLDVVVLMLGTNELKHAFQNSAQEIGNRLEENFVKIILDRKSQFQDKYPKLIIISPPKINEKTKYAQERYIGGEEKSKELKDIYLQIAKKNNCSYLDASNLEVGTDGVHMIKESHIKLAELLAERIKSIQL